MTADELQHLRDVLALRRAALIDRLATDAERHHRTGVRRAAGRHPHRNRRGRCRTRRIRNDRR